MNNVEPGPKCRALFFGLLVNWPVFGYDAARSSAVYGDRALRPSNVAQLRLRWRTSFDDVADSTPILVSVPAGGKTRQMLIQTVKNGTTYGIDANSGRIVWRFLTQGPGITTSTPAADPSRRWVYAPGVDGYVHKLEAASGQEVHRSGFPVRITLMPRTEKNASALNVANGYLYAVTSGYFGDAPPYDGHIVAVRLSDGSANVFNSLCSARHQLPTPTSCAHSASGIWSRGGAVIDPDPAMHGRVYFATGNGNFDARGGGEDYGDSVIALNADATKIEGYYTPENYAELEENDADLGSTSPALLPREARSSTPLMLVQGGKDSILRLVNRAHLPGLGGELQKVDLGSQLYSTPAVWGDSSKRTWVYLGLAGRVRAYRLETDGRGNSRLDQAWSADAGETEEGTSPVVSNGVVFVAMSNRLVALDARTGKELWNSAQPSAGGSIGQVHWQSPIVVNAAVYCSDQNGNLTAYALR